ncbi:hypothetical protein FM113_07620 [Leucobacter sp. 7(1)]|nr:hypothetical protein FM113_07620 [Leucobacter sp. 7(1)]
MLDPATALCWAQGAVRTWHRGMTAMVLLGDPWELPRS